MKKKLRLVCLGVILCVLLGLPLPLSLADSDPEVSIDAPADVEPDSQFTASVNITEVSDFDACQFDVTYDPGVVEVTDVTAGDIGGTTIPIDMWGLIPAGEQGKIRVIGNVPSVPGVSGSGYLAEIHFHVIGSPGSTSDIGLSEGLLGDKYANAITPVTWVGTSVHVSEALPTTETVVASETPAPTVASAPPSSDTPSPSNSTPVSTPGPTGASPTRVSGAESESGGTTLPIAIYALIFVVAIGAAVRFYRRAAG